MRLLTIAAAGLALASCSAPSPPPAVKQAAVAPPAPKEEPASIKQESDRVRSVERKGDDLVITLMVKPGNTDADVIEDAASSMFLVAYAVKRDPPEAVGAKNLVYRVLVPAMDRLGKAQDGQVIDVSFPMADVERAVLENLGPVNFLDLASVAKIRSGIGNRGVLQWCRKQAKTPEEIPEFCVTALG